MIDSLEIAHLICKCRFCIKTNVRGCSSKPDMGVNLCGFVGPGDRNGGVSPGRETVVHLNVQARRCSFLGTLSALGRQVHTLANVTTRMFACLMGSDPMIMLGFRVSLLYRFSGLCTWWDTQIFQSLNRLLA